jgi:hypothetical protein
VLALVLLAAERAETSCWTWPRQPAIVSLPWRTNRRKASIGFSTDASEEYPNFSHGTAGNGYFLSELYEATKDERYLLSALAAGHYLQSIVSKAESSQYLIFHDDAGGRDLFYLG